MAAVDETETLSPELFARIRAIQIRTDRLVTDLFAGEYSSAFKGRGMEFDEVRDYVAGDDIRRIDWNVTARMDAPFVKVHREERELTVMIVVDVSASAAFGSGERLRSDLQAELAALLAYTAIRSNDRVGLLLFSDRVELFMPPKKGRAHVWRVIRSVLTHRTHEGATDISGALEYLARVVRRKAVCFLISDFLGADYEDRLRATARRHDLTVIQVGDPREHQLSRAGMLELQDAETGETLLIDTDDAGLRRRVAEAARERQHELDETFRRCGVGVVELSTDGDFLEPVVRYFRRRERRGGHR